MVAAVWVLLAACGAKTGLVSEERARDAAADAAADAGLDAGRDAATDAATDAGDDAGRDAGPAECGNGLVEPGEECDLGDRNADVAALRLRQGDREWLPQPVGSIDAPRVFYDYRSESAHTGYERPRRASMLVYRDWDQPEDYLVFVFSQDEGGFDGSAEITVRGLEPGAIVLGDEPDELLMSSGGTASASYHWFSNSDGGVISLPCPGTTTVTIGSTTFIDDWVWTAAGGPIELELGEDLEIECAAVPSGCRTDCRRPRCGDDWLDPGEDCDRDGCPAREDPEICELP